MRRNNANKKTETSGILKHSWINFPSSKKRKCTRCDVFVLHNNNVITYIKPNGEETKERPFCKEVNEL